MGNLKNEVQKDIYGQILNNSKLFKLNFTVEFLSDLSMLMREKRIGPDEIIYNVDEDPAKMFFITKG